MSVKDKWRAMGVADRAKSIGIPVQFDDGPDVSGINNAQPDLPGNGPQSMPETALHSGLQGVSYGLADEAQGLIGAGVEGVGIGLEKLGLKDKPEDLADPVMGESTAPSALERVLREYRKTRDAERSDLHRGEQDNPKTALVSEIAGSLAAPGPKAKAAKGLARVAEGAKAGAKMGAAYGFGKSEADSVPGVVRDTAAGGVGGGVTGGIIGGVSALAQPMLRRVAESQAARAMGAEGGISDKMRRMGVGDEEARHELARTALDQGLLSGLPSKATVADRARAFVDQGTNAKNALLANSEATGVPFDPSYAAAKARGALTNLDPRAARNLGPAARSIEDIEALRNGLTDESVVAADKLKSSLQGGNNYADPSIFSRDQAGKLDKKVAAALRQAIEEHAENSLGGGAGAELSGINRGIGQGLKIEEIAKNAASRAAQRNAVGLGDKMMMASALASGSPDALGKAGGYGVLHSLANRFGNGVNAQALDALQKGVGDQPATRAIADISDEDKRRLARYLGLIP